jgi:hypothetical protein
VSDISLPGVAAAIGALILLAAVLGGACVESALAVRARPRRWGARLAGPHTSAATSAHTESLAKAQKSGWCDTGLDSRRRRGVARECPSSSTKRVSLTSTSRLASTLAAIARCKRSRQARSITPSSTRKPSSK